MSTRIWVLLALAFGTATACGPGDTGGPGSPPCASDSECESPLDACEQSVCREGVCAVIAAPAGVPCDDGAFCSEGEVCNGAGECGGGLSPCLELSPGIPRCNEAERQCEVCSDGRPLVDGQCRCPFWNCIARGGATYCAETDLSEVNSVSCFYDGLTLGDLPPPVDGPVLAR